MANNITAFVNIGSNSAPFFIARDALESISHHVLKTETGEEIVGTLVITRSGRTHMLEAPFIEVLKMFGFATLKDRENDDGGFKVHRG